MFTDNLEKENKELQQENKKYKEVIDKILKVLGGEEIER